MGIFVEYELIFPMSLMAVSSLLKSKGITPDITSIASRLAVDGKPRIIDNPFLCTVFDLSRLSLFPICHTQLAYDDSVNLIGHAAITEMINLQRLPIGYEIKSGMGTGSRNLRPVFLFSNLFMVENNLKHV